MLYFYSNRAANEVEVTGLRQDDILLEDLQYLRSKGVLQKHMRWIYHVDTSRIGSVFEDITPGAGVWKMTAAKISYKPNIIGRDFCREGHCTHLRHLRANVESTRQFTKGPGVAATGRNGLYAQSSRASQGMLS
ncbi:uncharacterized protein PgNI_00551 [Pyricularia grisea]|uniref:Uncharacterized protein n=1 Tax=Pyricularia grisea TaxID=148305 RepID=A0A6P8BGH2_PYRGI|nr:uncharacterized protein PgNI_00551 [Pyricularia grisea]TLD15966.1 hypothetical protein PgNI_00551 [Pyricularia grisea]